MNDRFDQIRCSFQTAAWLAAGSAWNLGDPGRPFAVVPASVNRIFLDDSSDDPPLVSQWEDASGAAWKRFELPAGNGHRRDGHNSGSFGANQLLLEAEDSELERLSCPPQSDLPYEAVPLAEELVDRHIELISRLFDEKPPGLYQWDGKTQGVAFRSCRTVAHRWMEQAASREPRMALIVRLAQDLSELLTNVCQRPRHTLRRERQLQPVNRIREIDGACLRWLSRQPGQTLSEKAGAKQLLMSVARIEDLDTPENRVVRDLLIRGRLACARYLGENRHHPEHHRVSLVARFQRRINHLLADSPISQASPLVGIPQPNYVLLHDGRYQKLWRAYIQLVRQQMLEDSVWRWRHRLFAEDCLFGCLAILNCLSGESRSMPGDVLLRLEQVAGRFVDARTTLGGWAIHGDSRDPVDLVLGSQLAQHPLVPKGLVSLAPDFVLIRCRSEGREPVVAAIWCEFDFANEKIQCRERLPSMGSVLVDLVRETELRALLIRPLLDSTPEPIFSVEEFDPIRAIQVNLPLQQHFENMVEQFKWALKLN